MQRPHFRGSKHFSYFYDIYFSKEFSPNKQSCLKIPCVLRFQARPHPGWWQKDSVPYHVPWPSPVALHGSLVNGPGFETWCCRSCPTGHDVYKGQRAVAQLCLSPSRNFVGRLSRQIGHWARGEICTVRKGPALQWQGESFKKWSASLNNLSQDPLSLGLCFLSFWVTSFTQKHLGI